MQQSTFTCPTCSNPPCITHIPPATPPPPKSASAHTHTYTYPTPTMYTYNLHKSTYLCRWYGTSTDIELHTYDVWFLLQHTRYELHIYTCTHTHALQTHTHIIYTSIYQFFFQQGPYGVEIRLHKHVALNRAAKKQTINFLKIYLIGPTPAKCPDLHQDRGSPGSCTVPSPSPRLLAVGRTVIMITLCLC